MSLECRRDSLPLELLELELLELELLELEPLLLAALHQRICSKHVLRVARKSGPRRALCIPTSVRTRWYSDVAGGLPATDWSRLSITEDVCEAMGEPVKCLCVGVL